MNLFLPAGLRFAAITYFHFLTLLAAPAVPVVLRFDGSTSPGSKPFTSGQPFTIELTYDTTSPGSYPVGADGSGTWYQNAVSELVFNYDNGGYVGRTVYSDIMVFHGPLYSGESPVDLFWVTAINGEGFPLIGSAPLSRINSAFGVEAPYGSAFQDSSLPDHLASPPFFSRRVELVWVNSTGGESFHFYGVINSVQTIPEPGACGVAGLGLVLLTMRRKRARN